MNDGRDEAVKHKSYRILPRFMGGMECSIYDVDRHLKLHDFGEAHHLCARQKPIGKRWTLHFTDPEPGHPFNVPPEDTDGSIWRKQILDLVERGHYFDFWGVFAMEYVEETKAYRLLAAQVDQEEHRWIIEHAGPYFLGYGLGEFDGLYQRDALPFADPHPADRRQAHRHWREYQQKLKGYLHDYIVATCALTFPHHYGEMGARMLAQEMGQGLLNHQVTGAFLRGASRQYDLDFGVVVSGFDRWGCREYTKGLGDDLGSPHAGHSPGFQVRSWYLCWLYGAVHVLPEVGHYAEEVVDGVRQLSPIGEAYESFCEWARDPGPLPEMHCPIALVLDYHGGWMPPHQFYSVETYRVWGDLPYEKGDFAVHALFDYFYPGYDRASLYRDERGFMVPTPLGDCIDVFLTNTNGESIQAFPVAFLWGLTDVTAPRVETLLEYVERGNTLVLSCANLNPDVSDRLGVTAGAESRAATHSRWTATGYEFREEKYLYREPLGEGRNILATSEEGICTIAEFARGKGRVLCLGAEYGSTDRLAVPGAGELDPPYELLNVVKHLLGELAGMHAVFLIEGEPIHWVTNGDGGTGTLLSLFNHTDRDWCGRVKGMSPGAEFRDRLTNELLPSHEGHCRTAVPAQGLRILEII
ncbi:MAG: hypothetical protein HQ559_14580 [Lentisphaerae bacterium]|nr:hypothetical protein [Lentisphaerota bacterium]